MSGLEEKRLTAALQPLISRLRTDDTVRKGPTGQYRSGEALTPERLAQHLNGGPVRGCYIMRPGESVTLVGVLDLDSHKGETPWREMTAAARALMVSIELMGGAPLAFRSSGGNGIHLYVMWETAQDAYSVRHWLTDCLTSCSYKNGTGGVAAGEVEIFPKSDALTTEGKGSFGAQVILPLGGKSVPLVWEPLADDLMTLPREVVLSWVWPMSDPVERRERPVRVALADGTVGVELATVREALAAISGAILAGAPALGHDPWRALVQAIQRVSGGSEEGRGLAHWFSSSIPDYGPERLDEVWDTSDPSRSDGVGAGTIFRTAREIAGWHEPIDDSGFDDISAQDSRPPMAGVSWTGTAAQDATLTSSMTLVSKIPPPISTTPQVRRRGIPQAHYLTTDQANAQRLKNSFGSMVFVSAGKWHVWDGKRWVADESDVYRYACRLSDLVREEAKPYRSRAEEAKARGDTADEKLMNGIADALGKWATRCEMKGTIEAAIGLARKMLTVESEALDRDPWALNCLNGTVDLRTGVLRRHDPAEYITKLVPVAYRAEATCPTWERALLEIVGGSAALAGYLARWFGYCLTGKTTEQAFVVHWGPGGNGKSVVLETMAATMGDYAGTAAPGLLVASKGSERHPTEIAALFGRRMVTAHESGEGVVLREDFVKQATGGDKLTARYMREDFFEFTPTHKIQLLTNHKPQIKGQDAGIWRRVQLVPYGVSFGSVEQVAAGTHDVVRDLDLMERLRVEAEGVLAWRVRGAVEWVQRGLEPPDVVMAASEGYKREQDRIGQFVGECCETGTTWSEPLTEGMGGGLYPAYVSWCRDAGIFPVSKLRFLDDVLRVVPGGRAEARLVGIEGGGRRKVKILRGIRLLTD